MTLQWIGAVFIIGSCGGCGFSMASYYRREEQLLTGLKKTIQTVQWELQYRLTPLPDLIRLCSGNSGLQTKKILIRFSDNLDNHSFPDVNSCMHDALYDAENLPDSVIGILNMLGESLGRFDLSGQLNGLKSLESECDRKLFILREGNISRLRSYRVLGICAGIALAVLFV